MTTPLIPSAAARCAAREAEIRENGRDAATDYPDSRPPHAEAMATDDAVQMAKDASVTYYDIHISSFSSPTQRVTRLYWKTGVFFLLGRMFPTRQTNIADCDHSCTQNVI